MSRPLYWTPWNPREDQNPQARVVLDEGFRQHQRAPQVPEPVGVLRIHEYCRFAMHP
jgi:hypothetical protein